MTTLAPAPYATGLAAPAAPAPALDAGGGFLTLPAGANAAGGYRAAVIELLVSGHDLSPLNASRQALVLQAVNDGIPHVPHTLDFSSLGVWSRTLSTKQWKTVGLPNLLPVK